MDFRVAPQAESDLDEIWYFLTIQSSNIDVADRVIDSITARFAVLARQPYIGRRRDDVEQFAVAERLRRVETHVGWFRIQAEPEFGLTAAVVGVTRRAVVSVVRHSFREHFGRLRNGIRQIPGGPRSRQAPHRSGDGGLGASRCTFALMPPEPIQMNVTTLTSA